jgi:hypothetical protein
MPVRESTDQKGTHPQGRAAAPGPRGVWAVAPAVSTPHCLRGTRQDLPCTSARNPAPEFEPVETRRATHMPQGQTHDLSEFVFDVDEESANIVFFEDNDHAADFDVEVTQPGKQRKDVAIKEGASISWYLG